MTRGKKNARLLFKRRSEAQNSGEGVFSGAIAHCVHDAHPDPLGQDQWFLSIVLVTVLGYLYLRRVDWIMAAFLVYYFTEYAVYYAWSRLSSGKTCSIGRSHSRSRELLLDPLCFAGSLFVAWYLFDYSVVGFGLGADPAVVADNFVLWRAVAVLLVATLSGHSRIYWLSAILLISVIWVAHLVCVSGASSTAASYSLWLAIRASGVSLALFLVGFVRPINDYYGYNAVYTLLAILWFTSMLHFIAVRNGAV